MKVGWSATLVRSVVRKKFLERSATHRVTQAKRANTLGFQRVSTDTSNTVTTAANREETAWNARHGHDYNPYAHLLWLQPVYSLLQVLDATHERACELQQDEICLPPAS